MSKGNISSKQEEILEYLKEVILTKGYPPSVREICTAVGLSSTSSVFNHLEKLEKNGYIRRDPAKPRCIEIVDDNFQLTRREMAQIPVVGSVAAGQPILAQQNINAGIMDGDQIFVEKCNTAGNGDIVVALIDDSATVKTFYKENGHFRLQPENDTMEPIIVDNVEILGRVYGVFRFFN